MVEPVSMIERDQQTTRLKATAWQPRLGASMDAALGVNEDAKIGVVDGGCQGRQEREVKVNQ